jgi:flagellar hook-basal body complex protein FliE
MRLESYDGAVQDYTVYLSLRPDAPQSATIEQLIALLKQKKAELEQQQQIAEDEKKAEEAKQKALLNDVMQSLDSASNDTKNLQAGTAPIQDTKPSFGLDD